MNMKETLGGRCQVVVDNGGVICGARCVAGVFCLRHHPSNWPEEDHRCMYIFDSSHRCTVKRAGSRRSEVCPKHRTPCVQCGAMTQKLHGLCRTCGAGRRPKGQVGDGNCQVVVDDGGTTCGARPQVDDMWCRRHDPAKWPEDRDRCLHMFDSGHRCLVRRKKGRYTELCEKHGRDCPTCGGKSASSGPCKRCVGGGAAHRGVTLHDAPAGLCQVVMDDGGLICGATAHLGCFCHRHNPAKWPEEDHRCLYLFDSGHRCIRQRKASRYGEVCEVHEQPCVGCGIPTNKLAGLCRTCGGLTGSLVYEKHATHADGTARLQCEVQIREDRDGTPVWCQYDADSGHIRCGTHRQIPPDGRRCHHRFSSGARCPQGIHHKAVGKDDYCTRHYSHRCPGVGAPCVRVPDGGARIKRATRKVCRWCEPGLRAAEHPCIWENLDGAVCGAAADPQTRLCEPHQRAETAVPSDARRCTMVYRSGRRCHRKRRTATAETCKQHRHLCPEPACSTWVSMADPEVRCRTHQPRCGSATSAGTWCEAAVPEHGMRCRLHDEDQPKCPAWAVAANRPCEQPVSASGFCGRHKPVPEDQRCTGRTPVGRCVNRRFDGQDLCYAHCARAGTVPDADGRERGPDGRLRTVACASCGTATAAKAGTCPACAGEDGLCWGTTQTGRNAGRRCGNPTVPHADGLCMKHRGTVPTDDDRCVEVIDDEQGGSIRCTGEVARGDDHCRVHGGKNRVYCAAWVQDPDGPYGQGKQCRTLALLDGTYCSLHRSLATMDPDDRCVIEYRNAPDGADARCAQQHELSRQGSGGVVCQQHRVPCTHDGCPEVTADLDRRLCQTHAPRCVVTVAEGRGCKHPAAAGEAVCMVHLATAAVDPADRCQHTFANGERCRADSRYGTAGRAEHRANYRQLCLQHYLPCNEPDCPRTTAFLDGRCFRHRPQCGWSGGCKRGGISPGGLCERHDRMAAAGPCVLTRINSKPCAHPASHHTDEGLICGRHLTEMPAGEDRCTYIHESGTRCPGTRPVHISADARRLFCAGWHPRRPTCRLTVQTWTPDDGILTRPCQLPVAVEASEGAICARHASNTADHEVRCLHVFEDGNRCTRTRREGIGQAEALVCPAHGLDRCSAISPRTRRQCSRRVAFDLDGEMICGLHAARMPAAQDRCTHYDDEGRRCAGRRVWFDGADQAADFCGAHSPHLCALPLASGRACANPARIDLAGEMVCGLHAARMPAAQDRCGHYDDEGRHCAGRRVWFDGSDRAAGFCGAHSPHLCSLPLANGRACANPARIDLDGEMMCGLHAARMPADENRCAHLDEEGRRCAGRRCLGSTGQVLKTCAMHIPRKRCSATLSSGLPCPWPGAVSAWGTPQDRCWRHPVLRDDEQCCAEEDGAACPRRRAHRIAFCADHRHLAPRCARVRHDRLCTQTALDGRDTCDRHASWRPDMPDDALDDLRMFLLDQQDRGRLDRLAWRLFLAREDLKDSWVEAMQSPYLPIMSHPSSTVCSTSVDTEEDGMGEQYLSLISDADYLAAPDEVRAVLNDSARRDPFDLTGASAAYARKLERARERGTELNWPTLHRTIENLAAGLAKGTLASAGSHLRALHAWMRTNQIATDQPFDPEDLQDYFGWLTDRGRLADGEPLQHGTVQGIRTAIVQLCRVKRWPDPFEQDPLLAMQIKGYGRLYGRVELRAHAVMVSELSRMVRAAIEQQADPYEVARDRTIVALCVGPNRIAYKAAARLRWENLVHLPEPGVDQPARFVLPGKPGAAKSVEQDFLVPNMSVLVTAEDYSAEHESVVLCGVQALRSLRAAAIRTGRCDDDGTPVGPVFDTTTTGKTGNGMSDEGLRRIVKRTWEVASADGTLFPTYEAEADWDTRYAVARAVGEPSFEELRNAALILVAWWASLRSEEASALTWGDITREKRDRGLILQVTKSKGDQAGTGAFVAIPYHHIRTPDGEIVPSIIDAATILSRYQDAWVRKTGRVPDPDDPIFLGKKGGLGPQGCRDAFDKLATAAKLEAELGERLTFHGLRAGFATTTLIGGMPAEEVARRQRRKSTVSLYAYFRLSDPFAGTLAAIFDYDEVGVDVNAMLTDASLLPS